MFLLGSLRELCPCSPSSSPLYFSNGKPRRRRFKRSESGGMGVTPKKQLSNEGFDGTMSLPFCHRSLCSPGYIIEETSSTRNPKSFIIRSTSFHTKSTSQSNLLVTPEWLSAGVGIVPGSTFKPSVKGGNTPAI
jgi:hypothetical protein